MFVQVITGRVVDADGLRRPLDRWESELRPGAEGFRGSTSGVTDDGRFVALARFDSDVAAERNSRRPEQQGWWAETEGMLDGVQFQNSVEVIPIGGGGSNDAGFVQVMRGRVVDPGKFDELRPRMSELEAVMADHRPDVIGGISVLHADGSYTDAAYFTSEGEARVNESKELPADLQPMFEEWSAVVEIDEYLDLRQPRLV